MTENPDTPAVLYTLKALFDQGTRITFLDDRGPVSVLYPTGQDELDMRLEALVTSLAKKELSGQFAQTVYHDHASVFAGNLMVGFTHYQTSVPIEMEQLREALVTANKSSPSAAPRRHYG